MTKNPAPTQIAGPRRGPIYAAVLGLAVLGAIALDTTVVHIGSDADTRAEKFSPENFGAAEFPNVQSYVLEHAVDGLTIAPEVLADKKAAGTKYGVTGTTGFVVPVTLTGVVGEAKAGVYDLTVAGLPADIKVRVQTGPAINGTDLRDASGAIEFGQFTNQIEYQDAGSALNKEMKKQVLDAIDTKALSGKTITVTGVFRLMNPKNWMITPVAVEVK